MTTASDVSQWAQLREALDGLLATARQAADAYQRPDLATRVDRAVTRYADRELTVLIVGEFKQGKSTLVNALVNAPVCGVADDVSTLIPTTIRYGQQPAAVVEYRPAADDAPPERRTIELGEVAKLGTEQGNPGNREAIRSIIVQLPRRMLESGLVLVDTPGVGGLDSAHGAVTAAALGLAEMIVFVTDASQPLTNSEIEFLRSSYAQCPNVVIVQPKTDVQPAWRSVTAANRAMLDANGLASVEIQPVSSVLRQQAAANNDASLNEESGFLPLLMRLRDAALGRTARQAARTALGDAVFVIEQLQSTFEAERASLDDPEAASEVIANLEAAKQRADDLRSQSAKWQQTLNDGGQDLTSDMDHDLRLRFRGIVAASEEALGNGDPTSIWDEFESWLHQRIGFELSAHHQLIAARSNELASTVAQHFAVEEEALGVQLNLAIPTIQARLLRDQVQLDRPGLTGNALAAVRGSYGGLLMFGMVGQMAGMAMLNPLSVILGLGLGRRGLREEKKRQLTQRQQHAKMTVRKYLDDINVEAAKVSRDTSRHAHRDLRDEFAARAEQLQTTIRESLRVAEAALKEAVVDRQSRLADVDAELTRLAGVRTRADEIERRIGAKP